MILSLIPAYNEEKTIGEIVEKTKLFVDKVIVIDDGSNDNTAKYAKLHGALVVSHKKNKGVGIAISTGIKYAKLLKPDITLILDADGQHNPDDIPKHIEPIIKGNADIVLGSRFLNNCSFMEPTKLIGNKIFSFIIRHLTGTNITDSQTGYRALNYNAIQALELRNKFTYTHEMILDLANKKFRFQEVPISVFPRTFGKSKVASSSFKYTIKALSLILFWFIRHKISGKNKKMN